VESKAKMTRIRTTPRKARLIADAIRGKGVGDALNLLTFSIKKDAAEDFSKLLKSAVANMQYKNQEAAIDVDGLRIREVFVDQGPSLKRFRARAQGRGYRVLKRMCHVSVTISD
jgi:large subunit ribosomal protein L22